MSTATLRPRADAAEFPSTFTQRLTGDPAYRAFLLLRIAFTVAPIAFGLDKFFNVMVDWESYLAPGSTTSSPAAPPPRCTCSAWSRSPPASPSR